MALHNDLGKAGEAEARRYLEEQGYRILHSNWRFQKDEIDIVSSHQDFIVFTEVKTRSSGLFEPPEAAVTIAKQMFLIRAADAYIQKYDIKREARFDILSITGAAGSFEINHIQNAFYPTL